MNVICTVLGLGAAVVLSGCVSTVGARGGGLAKPDTMQPNAPTAPSAPPPGSDLRAPPAGLVLAAQVKGTVTMKVKGVSTDLRLESAVPAPATVNTGPESQAVLVFSNGVTLQLGANTELVLDEFLQDPFGGPVSVAQLKEEPSVSRTNLALNRGDIVGSVPTLKSDRGSAFTVRTPAGVADVRSGVFRVALVRTEGGHARFTLSSVDSVVRFSRASAAGATRDANEVIVRPGQEIDVSVGVGAKAAEPAVVSPARTRTAPQ